MLLLYYKVIVGSLNVNKEKRILYIDDNQDHLTIVHAMLQRDGYDCDTFGDAEEGLDAALNQKYDLILLDIQMPKINGIDMLAKLKARKQETNLKVVAITANSSVFSSQSPFVLGFDGHLSKPIMPKELSRIVTQLLTVATE